MTHQLASGLRTLGHEPLVITNRWPKSLSKHESFDGLPVIRHTLRVPHRSVRGVAGWLLLSAATRREVIRDARVYGCDAVNVHCVSSNAEYAMAAAEALRLPLIVSLHGELSGDASNRYERDPRLRDRWRRLIDRAAVVTAPSAFTLAEGEGAYGMAFGERGRVIRNGVDMELFAGERTEPVGQRSVISFGRLVVNKGFDLLLEAWEALPAKIDARLVIGGDGPERVQLEQRAARSVRSGTISFAGRLERADVAQLLRSASVFVLPSRAEALGLTVLEAMAAGTPVVAAEVGGVPELVQDNQTGLLFSSGDADDLARVLAQCLEDPGAARQRADRARAVATANSWRDCVTDYESAYLAAGCAV